jgi:hypothetical protein
MISQTEFIKLFKSKIITEQVWIIYINSFANEYPSEEHPLLIEQTSRKKSPSLNQFGNFGER